MTLNHNKEEKSAGKGGGNLGGVILRNLSVFHHAGV